MNGDKRPGTTSLRVGRLVKAHGLKGALKVELYTDDPAKRFFPGAEFSLQVPATSDWHGKSIELAELRWYNEHPVAFFVGIDDRTAAETLVKAILWIDADIEAEQEPDAWYDHQLVDLVALRDGNEIGRVVRVEHLPAQDLLVILHAEREVLVPFVSAIVPTVDLAAGTLTLTPPAGLFEELPAEAEVEAEAPDAAAPAPDAAAPEAGAEAPEPGDDKAQLEP